MSTVLDAAITEVLTDLLGRAPTADEIIGGQTDALVMTRVIRNFQLDSNSVAVSPSDNLQTAINNISTDGGGSVLLQAGTYDLTADITIPSNVVLNGVSSNSTILDFGNLAFGVKIVGSNSYTTGSVTLNFGDTTVVGTGTTFTSGMVGQSIMLEDLWYEITAFTDVTHITIGETYGGSNLTNNRYAIATIIENPGLNNLTVQNSSIALVTCTYVSNMNGYNLIVSGGLVGLDYDWVSAANHPFLTAQLCGTGIMFDDVTFATTYPNSIGNTGDGIVTNNFRNSVVVFASIQGNGGRGLAMQNTHNIGIENCAFQANSGIGVEFIDGCYDIQMVVTTVFQGGSDGVKFTANTDDISITACSIHDNAGFGVNIANANCNNNVISANNFYTNTSGHISDSGTDTVISGNSPSWVNVTSVAHSRATAQVAANTNILTYTVGSNDASFQVLANVLVTTSTTHSFGVTVDYTDESNTSRTLTLPVAQLAGTLITAITNVTGAGPYEGVSLSIRCKAATNIVFKTAGTFTSVAYNVDASIIKTS